MRPLSRTTAIAALLLVTAAGLLAQQPPQKEKQSRALPTQFKEFTGDFDGMLERRVLRVVTPFSRTLFFNDKGTERGVTVDLFRQFERYVNQKYAKQIGKRPFTVVMIPTTRDQMLADVAAGLGDVAAGNLTVTPEREKVLDFCVSPDLASVSELVLTGPNSPVIATVDDLAGQTVHLRKSSSYYESLAALNDRFAKEGRPPIALVLVPDALEDEDLMEMLNVGILSVIVVDDWMAKMWAPVFPKVKVHTDVAVRTGGQSGFGVRKGSPQLAAILGEFFAQFLKKQGPNPDRTLGYSKRVRQLTNPTGGDSWKRFQSTLGLFYKYGEKYGFDPLMLAAQGYQESTLNQEAKSPVGAVGLMQLMPATGAELNVGDITVAENNVHAGAKYMDKLMAKYLGDAAFDETNRTLFAFACYNAGPGNIAKMRKLAESRGLDPQQWFNNVEIVTAEKIGLETTTYVRNIYKYYVSYRLMLDAKEAHKKAKEEIKKAP